MITDEEIWKTHCSGYEVSSQGRVKGRKVDYIKSYILSGYPVCKIRIDGKAYTKSVHRLVAEAFLGSIPDGMVVNHKDGNKLNPKLSNLEIITEKQNSIHAFQTGLLVPKSGEDHPMAILSENDVKDIYRRLKNGEATSQISKIYGISNGYVRELNRGTCWKELFKSEGMSYSPPPSHKSHSVSEEKVAKIIENRKAGLKIKDIAKEYSLPVWKVSTIVNHGYEKSVNLLNKTNNFKYLKIDRLPGEKWKIHPILGKYVSNLGRIVGFFGKIRKLVPDRQGYTKVTFSNKCYRAHRLIWETFKGPIPDGMEINHINRIKNDNRLVNLELVTSSENMKHFALNNTPRHGSQCKISKLTEVTVKEIKERLKSGEIASLIAKEYGVSDNSISCIKHNKTWKHVI